jgi:hypothetical protein
MNNDNVCFTQDWTGRDRKEQDRKEQEGTGKYRTG